MSRLADSKRNELIDKFREGIEDPEYEVIPNKTQKGKYTVRRRKNVQIVTPDEPSSNEPAEEEEEEYEQPIPTPKRGRKSAVDPSQLFYEYQTQMNRMMIENMKMMRQQVKAAEKKRAKNKAKTRKYFDILDSVANEVEQQQRAQPPPQEPQEEEETEERPPEPEPESQSDEEQPAQEFDYQAAVDDMAGLANGTVSRRNRLKTERFGI